MKGEVAGWLGQGPPRGPRVIPSPLAGRSHPCKWIEVSEPQQGIEGALGSKSKGPPALLHSEPSDALLTLGCHAGFCVSRPQTIPGTLALASSLHVPMPGLLPYCLHPGPLSTYPVSSLPPTQSRAAPRRAEHPRQGECRSWGREDCTRLKNGSSRSGRKFTRAKARSMLYRCGRVMLWALSRTCWAGQVGQKGRMRGARWPVPHTDLALPQSP